MLIQQAAANLYQYDRQHQFNFFNFFCTNMTAANIELYFLLFKFYFHRVKIVLQKQNMKVVQMSLYCYVQIVN